MTGHGERACRIQIFSTCPASTGFDRDSYVAQVVRVAQWSERARCEGILVYTDNSLVDPWLVAQLIIQHTDRLCPLVAVQPVYMHPYTVAKLVATLGFLSRRRLYLNMVAGGFKNDLQALNDPTPHDQRYERLVEYTMVIKQLLAGTSPVTFDGQFYKAAKLKMVPPLSADLFPGITLSGSSEAGLAAAKATGAIAIHCPKWRRPRRRARIGWSPSRTTRPRALTWWEAMNGSLRNSGRTSYRGIAPSFWMYLRMPKNLAIPSRPSAGQSSH